MYILENAEDRTDTSNLHIYSNCWPYINNTDVKKMLTLDDPPHIKI